MLEKELPWKTGSECWLRKELNPTINRKKCYVLHGWHVDPERECGDNSLHYNKWVVKTTWVCFKQMTNIFGKFILCPLVLGNIPYSIWLRQVNFTAEVRATPRKAQWGVRLGKPTALLHKNNGQTQPGQNIQNWATAGPRAESRAFETPMCHIKTRKLSKNLETFVYQNEGLPTLASWNWPDAWAIVHSKAKKNAKPF